MSIIFNTNEARKAFYDVIRHERNIKQGEDMRLLQDMTLHHIFAWGDHYKDKQRFVLISYCSNDKDKTGHANEFSFLEYFVPMMTIDHTYADGAKATLTYFPNDTVPCCLTKDTIRGMNGGIINHGTKDNPRWSIHT